MTDAEPNSPIGPRVEHARRVFAAVEDELQDAVGSLPELELAAETLWDLADDGPETVLRVARLIQPAFVRAEPAGPLTSRAQKELRIAPQVLLMRAEYRVPGQERIALLTAVNLLSYIQSDVVDGPDALLDVLTHHENPVAEAAVAVLGLYPAALLRSGLKELPPSPAPVYEQYRALWVRLARAYFGTTGPRADYPRTFAMAAQGLQLLCDDPRPEEEDLVHLVYETECRCRPTNERGQATLEKREIIWARYKGEAHRIGALLRAGTTKLAEIPLRRQLAELQAAASLA